MTARTDSVVLHDGWLLFGGNNSVGQHDFEPENFPPTAIGFPGRSTGSRADPAPRQTIQTCMDADGHAYARGATASRTRTEGYRHPVTGTWETAPISRSPESVRPVNTKVGCGSRRPDRPRPLPTPHRPRRRASASTSTSASPRRWRLDDHYYRSAEGDTPRTPGLDFRTETFEEIPGPSRPDSRQARSAWRPSLPGRIQPEDRGLGA